MIRKHELLIQFKKDLDSLTHSEVTPNGVDYFLNKE